MNSTLNSIQCLARVTSNKKIKITLMQVKFWETLKPYKQIANEMLHQVMLSRQEVYQFKV